MEKIQLEVSDEVLSSLKATPESLAREVRIAAAVKLFELGKLSQGRAADLAGMPRVEFLDVLGSYKVSPFITSPEQLERDVANA